MGRIKTDWERKWWILEPKLSSPQICQSKESGKPEIDVSYISALGYVVGSSVSFGFNDNETLHEDYNL